MDEKQTIRKVVEGQLHQLQTYLENIQEHGPELFDDLKDIYHDLIDIRNKVIKKSKEE